MGTDTSDRLVRPDKETDMRRLSAILAVVLALALAAGACSDGGDGATPTTSGTAASPGNRAPTGEGKPDDVPVAPEDGANRPEEGTYLYRYESEVTNASTPDATPRRSKDDAVLTSEVTVDGEVVTIAERTTEGKAVATVVRRYTDEAIVEESFETEAPQGSSGCDLSDPITVIPFPLEATDVPTERFSGEGSSCDGERTVEVIGQEEVTDAEGRAWSTWKIVTENVVRSGVGVTSRSELTTWFSPALGKEIKSESVVESINAEGQVGARGETSTLLVSYPA